MLQGIVWVIIKVALSCESGYDACRAPNLLHVCSSFLGTGSGFCKTCDLGTLVDLPLEDERGPGLLAAELVQAQIIPESSWCHASKQ